MDHLKQQVVDNVFARVRQCDGDGIYNIFDEPPTIDVLPQVGSLILQLRVETPIGLRFFEVIVKEAY